MKKFLLTLSGAASRLAGVLAVVLLLTVPAGAAAQGITMNLRDVTVQQAVMKLQQDHGYSFSANADEVDMKRRVNVTAEGATIENVLEQIFAGQQVSWKVNGKSISVGKAAAPSNNPATPSFSLSGRVVDENGEGIIGATVVLKGTATGVSTGAGGNFNIRISGEKPAIEVSFIGFTRQEIAIAPTQTSILVTLRSDVTAIDDVVVIGYGVMNKRDVSTSIASVKSEDLVGVPITDFREALIGKMAGVQVLQTSGDPEGSLRVRVRGISSVNAGNDPLYIIDGVPVERGLENLNNNDIESVEVLKDASAAAIYGSRGSNGVVLITTKKGRSERVTVNYDGYYGVQQVSKKLPMMNAYQFAEAARDGHNNAYLDEVPGGSVDDPNSVRPQTYHQIPPELFPYLEGEQGLNDTDWQDAIFRNASVTSHNVSISGQGQKLNYYVSANYFLKEGVIIGSDFERYGMRMNLDGQHKNFKFGVNFSPSYSQSNRVDASGPNGIVSSALQMPPVWPVYNEDGTFNYQGNGYWRIGTDYQHNALLNPVAQARLQSDVLDRVALVGNAFLEYEFMKGLSYKLTVGGDFYGTHNDKYRSSELPLQGHAYYDQKSNPEGYSASAFYYNWLVENQISYNTVIGGDHSLSAVLVQSAQKETYKGNNVTATDYPNDYIQTITGGGTVTKGNSDKTQWSLASYLARAQYSYKGKYMLSAAVRADGSSRFGKNNRWGYFPSASAAWRLSDENFFRNTEALGFVNDVKLRASYGVTGNFQIGNYEHLSTMSYDDYILGTGNGGLVSGYKPDRVENEDLKWEKTKMVNAGIDVTLWKGLLTLTAEFYDSNTSDMLLSVPIPHLAGHSTARMNIGKVNNRGWEFQASSFKQMNRDLSFGVNANFSMNRNKVRALGAGDAPIISTGSVDHAYYITRVGSAIGSYYVLVYDGIFRNSEELNAYPHFPTTQAGDFRFVDVDGNGVMDLDDDRMIVGNYMPDFTYSFGANAYYKGFDFSVTFQGTYGNEILNLNRRYIDNLEGNTNGTTIALDRWRSEAEPGNGLINRANRKQKGYNGRISTWHIEDGSYLRLQNLTVGYTLPQHISRKFLVEKLRVYFTGQNLFTWTDYSGYNPEVSRRPDNSLSPGEDYGTYPLAKTFMVGLNITF